MTNGIRHPSMYLFVIFIFFGKTSDHVFCPLSNWTVFFLLNFESCFHGSYISSLLETGLANNFSLWFISLSS